MPIFHIILGTLLAFLPAVAWLIIWYKKDSQQPEPKRMVLLAFCFGMVAVVPFMAVSWQLQQSPHLLELWNNFSSLLLYTPILITAIALAFFEEALKHFAALRLGKKLNIVFDQIVDGIIYSVAAGLGFAFAENILYFLTALQYYDLSSTELWSIVAFRSFGTTLGHSIFSGIFGLFWGHAFLSKSVTKKHSFSVSEFFIRFKDTLRFHIIFSHILKKRPSLRGHEKGDLVREALLLATLVHAIFNLFLELELFGKQLTFLIVPILMLGFLFLSKQFFIPKNVEILKPV